MGRMLITFDELYSYLNYRYDIYTDEQRFLNDFYNIGFIKKSNEVLDLNVQKYPQIDFSYDDLTRVDKEIFYKNYKDFLLSNEKLDDILFYIAENYYETFMNFKSEFTNQFAIIKSTFVKRPDFEKLVSSIDIKINYFKDMLNRVQYSREDRNLTARDLSMSLKGIQFDKTNYELFNDISNDISNFENMNQRYFDRDRTETIRYFEIAISNLEKIRDKLTLNEDRYDRYENNISFTENMNLEMSAPKMAPSFSQESDEFDQINLIEDFNELRYRLLNEIGIRINSDIYINFLALNRVQEHYEDINELKSNIGTILKN